MITENCESNMRNRLNVISIKYALKKLNEVVAVRKAYKKFPFQ